MLPSIFRDNLFDDMFDFDDFDKEFNRMMRPLYGKHAQNMMKTDVRETDNSYELDIDLPGFKKDEIKVELDNGYLSISAAKGLDKDEEKKDGKYIRRERYAGAMNRTFYVGDNLTQQDIQAKFEDGILKIMSRRRMSSRSSSSSRISISRSNNSFSDIPFIDVS